MNRVKQAVMLLAFSIAITSNCLSIQARRAAPEVTLTVPANGETAVAADQKIRITFSKQINPSTINHKTFILKNEATNKHISGKLRYSRKRKMVSFKPKKPLADDTQYFFKIKGNDQCSLQVKDWHDRAMKDNYKFSFSTGSNISSDINAPMISFTNPENGDTNVAINSKITATFNEIIDSNTLEFNLKQGGELVTGIVSYLDKTAMFTPDSNLASNLEYVATITNQVKDLNGNALANNYVWSFTTGVNIDNSAPSVRTVSPVNATTNIALNTSLSVEFSEALDQSTVNNNTFILEQGSTLISGTVTYSGRIATFHPTSNLATNSSYKATVTNQVKDLVGNALANNYVWSFSTGANVDNTLPSVELVSPVNGSTNVAINSSLSVDFSEELDQSTVNSNSFILQQGTTLIPGTVTYSDRTATLHPTTSLVSNSSYKATITTQVNDLVGNALASNYVWSFTTSETLDTLAPTVELVSPVNGSTNVAINSSLSVDFSEELDQLTVNSNTFILEQGTTLISGTVTYSGRTAVFHPTTNLVSDSTYRATVVNQVKDLAANTLASNYVWNFTTGTDLNQNEIVVLRSTSDFAILAGSTVTNTGPTIVNGNLGLSPGSAVTGFPPGSINGVEHINDTTSAQAKLDLTAAYNDAAGRTLAPVTVAGNIGGQTLAPGLYKSTSTLAISGGDLTLDALGDANAVFIFQVASGFTVTSGRQVILSGGALASNIFWQVGTSATIGTTATFKGNILADQSITFETGASLVGRALTRIGAVSLDSNIISKP